MIQIEINDERIDVDADQLPGFYYALQDLIDLSALKGSRSTTMRIPATNAVRRVLGGWSMVEEADEAPLPFRVTTGGAVIFSGKAKVISRSADEYEIVAIGDNAAWKDGASKLNLREIPMGISDDVTASLQKSTWTDDESLLYFPLISYGALKARDNAHNVTSSYLRPALRVWQVLRRGFALLGYSIEARRGLLATKDKFVLPNTTSETFSINTDPDDVALRMYQVQDGNDREYRQAVAPPSDPIPDEVDFPNRDGNFGVAPGRFEPNFNGYVAVSMVANFRVDRWDGPTNGNGIYTYTINYVLFDYADSVVKATVSRNYGGSNGNPSQPNDPSIVFPNIEVVSGHSYGVAMYSDDSQYMLAGSILNGFTVGAVTIYDATESNWLTNFLLYTADKPFIINTAAPDITLLDLLKWWTINQNITVRTDELTKHIVFEYYDDFCRPQEEGLEWTYRIDHTDPPRRVTDILPRAYQFRFTEDTDDRLVEVINRQRVGVVPYGGHDHDVPTGQDSPESVDIGFAPTAMEALLGGQVYIPAMHSAANEEDLNGFIADEYDWEPRILYADGLANGGWTFNGGVETEYPRCYFVWPETGRNNLSFGNETSVGAVTAGTVAARWRNRLRRSTAPTLEAFMRLYDYELMGFDFGRPLFLNDGQHGSWFYIIEVKRHQFLADGVTEVKMVRL